MKTKQLFLTVALASAFSLQPSTLVCADPLGTAFTYQGRLNDGGVSAQGIYDLRFTIYDTGEGGGIVAGPITNSPVGVSNGLFTVTLDFGGDVFIGEARWLEIGVRTNGATSFFTLTPRQPLTATPYALHAPTAGVAATALNASSVAAGSVGTAALASGAVDSSRIAPRTITTTNLNATILSNTFWRLDGNASTAPGANFLGTTDNQPLHLNVNGAAALRLEPTTNAPNVIGGSSGNYIAPGVVGAAIAGGGNPATPSSNRIAGSWSFIGGGTANEVGSPRSVVAGGVGNVIEGGSTGVAIGGGSQNLVQSNSLNAHIGGGSHNTVQSNASVATIGGGGYNIVRSNALAATIPGGFENEVAGSYAFAAGRRARANHPGAFVWSDSTLTPTGFASTGTNQFLINAGGGVGIGTNNPQSALHVAGTVKADSFSGSGAGLSGISGGAIANGSITTAQLASNSITASQLAAGSVTTTALADGAVTAAKVATVSNWFALTIANPFPVHQKRFGYEVAAVGSDRVLIGADGNVTGASHPGAAYLFNINGTLLTIFTNPTPADYDSFGESLAVMGSDRVLIGAPWHSTSALAAGAAYLFNTNGALLTTFTNPTPADYDTFGYAVAAVGSDGVLIGVPGDMEYLGAAHLFSTNGTLLTTFSNPTPAAWDVFGCSVATVGNDRVVIGAYGDDTGAISAGAAYLFNTNGALLTTFTNPIPTDYAHFGSAVATVGNDRVLIGAYQDDGGATDAGAAYLFSTNGTLLTTFTNPTPADYDYFGCSVAAVGNDRMLIGAYGDDTGAINTGAAYLFNTNSALLTTLTNPTPTDFDAFAQSVAAVEGGRVLIGAHEDDTGATDAGAAYLFSVESSTPGLVADGVRAGSITTASFATGAVGSAQLAPNLAIAGSFTAGSFHGDGAGLTNLSFSVLPPGVVTNHQTGVTLGGTFNAATGLIIENRTSDPPSPAVGQIWLRTDF